MWHRVAALLGGRTIEELQQAMTSAEFVQWCAFYSIEPWGFEAQNWRMGVVSATVANYSGRAKKPLKPSDFIPSDKPRKRPLSRTEVRARLQSDIEKAKVHDHS